MGERFAPLVILGLAFALRLVRLDAQSLWWDEALSLKLALAPGIEWRPADAGHPPLYDYFVLKPWVWLVGPSEFAARFLSVALGVLAVALAYHLGRAVLDRRAGLVAAGLVALCGIQWWYSQEVRMYTLIACEILLLLILLERVLARPAPGGRAVWVGLALLEFAALYTQYLAAVVVGYVNLVAYAALLWRRDWATLRRWTLAQVLAALLVLPVLPWALGQVQGYVPPNATPLDPLPFLAQVWAAYLGGPLLPLDSLPLFERLALAAAALFGLATLWLALTRPTRARDLRLLSYALVPLLVIFVVMRLRPGFHPRYVVMLSAPWLVFTAVLARRLSLGRCWERGLALAVVGSLALAFSVGLWANVAQPDYQRDNVRALVRRLSRQATAQDAVLLDYVDYAFDHYYHGPAPALSLDMQADDAALAATVAQAVAGRDHVFVVAWAHAHADHRGYLPWLIQASGRQTGEWTVNSLKVTEYTLATPLPTAHFQPTEVHFGGITLSGLSAPPATPADQGLPIALRWRRAGSVTPGVRVSVTLLDRAQHVLARRDATLLDAAGRQAAQWGSDAEVVNYYLLTPPPGAPPDTYTVGVSVYDGATLRPVDVRDAGGAPAGTRLAAATVRLERGRQAALPDPSLRPLNRAAGPGLTLEGFAVEPGEVTPGQRLSVRLRWRATVAGPVVDALRLQLRQGDTVLAEVEGGAAGGTYPPAQWGQDEVVLDWRDLTVPPGATSGAATVQVQVGGEPPIPLAEVQVRAATRLLTPPTVQYPLGQDLGPVRLLGYDLAAQTVKAGEPLALTLYWQATGPLGDAPLTVFTHLLDASGRLIAQHDSPPAEGQRPTPGWTLGETVIDPHRLTFTDPGYTGDAVLEVGLYDPVSGARLPTPDGTGRLLLPTPLRVTQP